MVRLTRSSTRATRPPFPSGADRNVTKTAPHPRSRRYPAVRVSAPGPTPPCRARPPARRRRGRAASGPGRLPGRGQAPPLRSAPHRASARLGWARGAPRAAQPPGGGRERALAPEAAGSQGREARRGGRGLSLSPGNAGARPRDPRQVPGGAGAASHEPEAAAVPGSRSALRLLRPAAAPRDLRRRGTPAP